MDNRCNVVDWMTTDEKRQIYGLCAETGMSTGFIVSNLIYYASRHPQNVFQIVKDNDWYKRGPEEIRTKKKYKYTMGGK